MKITIALFKEEEFWIARCLEYLVTETGESTGIFQGTVLFTITEESTGNTLRVSETDRVTAEYEDSTLPQVSSTMVIILRAGTDQREDPFPR